MYDRFAMTNNKRAREDSNEEVSKHILKPHYILHDYKLQITNNNIPSTFNRLKMMVFPIS